MERSNGGVWYDKPAANWNEALPIGNGRLGGMVFGNVKNERIQLNEDSVWYGGPRNRINPDAQTNLQTIRQLLANGQIKEAEELAKLSLSGVPSCQRHYEPLGTLFMENDGLDEYSDYRRELDLHEAIISTTFRVGNVSYNREVFTTYPDQMLVMRVTASKPHAISMKVHLDRGNTRNVDEIIKRDASSIVMTGETGGKDGIGFAVLAKAIVEDGECETIGNRIRIKNATNVTILLSAATTFRYENVTTQCENVIYNVASMDYPTLKKRHVNDYQQLFHRVQLQFNEEKSPQNSLPMNNRLEKLSDGEVDTGLIATYFHFGRYLMIASSRPNSLPITLQGIWNDLMLPPWDSKYTININLQMNYWPVEVCNLAECHLPLFELIERMRETGRQTAKQMYGCRGFAAHHNTDIWADTAPQDIYPPASYWPMGAAWLSLHLWEHYLYTNDKEFLAKAYETMKEAALFFVDFLVENKDGLLITTPSVSPENTYLLPNGEKGTLCEAPTMDSQIIRALFTACIKTSEILDVDEEYSQLLISKRRKLPETKIGRYGQIQEWLVDYEEEEQGHRHISHLFGLYPSNEISPIMTPILAKAAEVTLQRRLAAGGGHTGWSRAWIINMWARLHNGDKALENIQALLQSSTLPNLFDNHPPFQIDGNFGGTAGIIEMIVQSHLNEIHLLPAIPEQLAKGYVKGIKLRGGFELEMKWNHHRVEFAKIRAINSGLVQIRVSSCEEVVMNKEVILPIEPDVFLLEVEADEVVTFVCR
jgi:alpha-L-fucosidase 2